MESIFGFFYFNQGFLIGSLLVAAVGAVLLAYGGSGAAKTIVGGLLLVIGLLALLSSFYFVDFRWLNQIAGGVLVLAVGVMLITRAPGIASTLIGLVVIILSVFYLSNTYPLNLLELNTSLGRVFGSGAGELMDILNLDGTPPNDSATP